MRLLIPVFSPSTGTWGGLTRVLAVAEAATQAGHQVGFCASGYLENALRGRGYAVHSMPPTTLLGLPAPLARIIEGRSQQASLPTRPGRAIGNIWFVLALSGMARADYLRRLVEAELQAVRTFRADALFTDLDPGAFLVGAITGLPTASAYASIMTQGTGTWAWKMMLRAFTPVLRTHHLPERTPDELCFGPRVLKIIPSIPDLDDTDPGRPDVRYVGHLLSDIRPGVPPHSQGASTRRHVFVYMGTGSIALGTLRRVLPRLFPANNGHICLVGAQSIKRAQRLGAVEFHPYVPAETLLPYCDWTICHGGQNTIVQSLRQGVPLIIFPGPIFERRFNAQRVQAAGAGLMGESPDFTVEWLHAALAQHARCAPQAAVLGERIRSYGGAAAAVEAIVARAG